MSGCDIPGWSDLVEWFGMVPDFHDAEVESIVLRGGSEACIVHVHAWRTNADTEESGYLRLDRHARVTFLLTNIVRLDLHDWYQQNVLSVLSIAKVKEGYILELTASVGLGGEIVAENVRIEVEPKAPEQVAAWLSKRH